MSGISNSVPSTKGTSTLVRPRFAPGMLLQHDDLDQLSTYTRDLSRLLFRSFFGCGVVCGLVVKSDPKCGQDAIVVGAGLGLDCAGDPIYVPKDTRVTIDENCQPNPNDVLWVVLCHAVKCCAPRPSICPSDDDGEETSSCTRERDGFEIRVVAQRPTCACSCVIEQQGPAAAGVVPAAGPSYILDEGEGCQCVDPKDPCYADHYLGVCGCGCDDCARGASCDCIVLARLDKSEHDGTTSWDVDHSVRRFIRPVLMRDPQPAIDRQNRRKPVVEAPAPAAAVIKPAKATTVGKGKRRTTRPGA
jgi:hypothetical protein